MQFSGALWEKIKLLMRAILKAVNLVLKDSKRFMND